MFLKIDTESQDAKLYKLTKTDFLIGSSPYCHILINDKTISKKHVRIEQEDGEWFVIDQGSTNGTFVEDEQLVPGKKVKLSGEFRLGSQVFLNLTSEGEGAIDIPEPKINPPAQKTSAQGSISSDQDRTRVISLDDMKQAKALAEQKKAKEQVAKKILKIQKKKQESSKRLKLIILSALILGGGFYLNEKLQKELAVPKREKIVKKIKGSHKAKDQISEDVEGNKIGRNILLTRNSLVELLLKQKCKDEEVKSLCGSALLNFGDNGVIKDSAENIIVFIEESELINLTKKQLSLESVLDYDSIQKASYLSLLIELFSDKTPDDKNNLYVAYYRYDDQKIPQLNAVFASNGNSTNYLFEEAKKFDFKKPDDKIRESITKLEEFFTVY